MNKGSKEIDNQTDEKIERIVENWQHWPFALSARPVIEDVLSDRHPKNAIPLNQTVCLRSNNVRLALRFPLRAPVSKQSQQLECSIQRVLAGEGVAPLVHLEEDCLISEWIEAEAIENIQNKHLDALLRCVYQFQSADVSDLNLQSYSYLEALKSYTEKAKNDFSSPDVRNAISTLEKYEEQFGDRRCLTHNDLNARNILWQNTQDAEPRCWIIDWEFAGLGIASFDLAGIAVEFELELNQLHRAALAIGLDVGKDELELAIDSYQLVCHFYRQAVSQAS